MDIQAKGGYQPVRSPDGTINDPLAGYPAYVKAMEFYDRVADDTDLRMRDPRARAIACQVIDSAGSVCANFEEGYGRGMTPEFVHRLRISLG